MTQPDLVPISWSRFDSLIERIAIQIEEYNKNHANFPLLFDYIAGIPRGGFIPACALAHRLGVRNLIQAGTLEYHRIRSEGKKILVVDEIVDSGNTLKEYIGWHNVITAALHVRYSSKVYPNFYGQEIKTNDWMQYAWENPEEGVGYSSR